MSRKLFFPKDIRPHLLNLYHRNRKRWLSGQQIWPIEIQLGTPSEMDFQNQSSLVHDWVQAWRGLEDEFKIEWQTKKWKLQGAQSIPHKLLLESPDLTVALIGEQTQWENAKRCLNALASRWDFGTEFALDNLETLESYSELDFERLLNVSSWLANNPKSGLYPRQLPVAGMDSKWFEGRRSVVEKLVGLLRSTGDPDDLLVKKKPLSAQFESRSFSSLGLKIPPTARQIRILDPLLRERVAGLQDFSAPIEDLAQLAIQPRRILIVENLQTFLALDNYPGLIAIFGMGYNLSQVLTLPWLSNAQCHYWGDIDTHGLAMLNEAKSIPGLRSLMMDRATLMAHRDLWGLEDRQSRVDYQVSLLNLSEEERGLFKDLKEQTFGTNIRLEQERIGWDSAKRELDRCFKIVADCEIADAVDC